MRRRSRRTRGPKLRRAPVAVPAVTRQSMGDRAPRAALRKTGRASPLLPYRVRAACDDANLLLAPCCSGLGSSAFCVRSVGVARHTRSASQLSSTLRAMRARPTPLPFTDINHVDCNFSLHAIPHYGELSFSRKLDLLERARQVRQIAYALVAYSDNDIADRPRARVDTLQANAFRRRARDGAHYDYAFETRLRGECFTCRNNAYTGCWRTTHPDQFGHDAIDGVNGDGEANTGIRARG